VPRFAEYHKPSNIAWDWVVILAYSASFATSLMIWRGLFRMFEHLIVK
jgi:hypothetical protein